MTVGVAEVAVPRASRPWRWLPWIGLVVIVAVALGVGSQRHSDPTLEQRTMSIASQVKCPVCVGETAAQSNVPESVQIRLYIRDHLVAGDSRSEILAQLKAVFGAGGLEKPPATGIDLVLWILPGIAVVAAAAGLVLLFRRWRPVRIAGVSEDDRRVIGVLLDRTGGVQADQSGTTR